MFVLAACCAVGTTAQAQAPPPGGTPRGELLYATHCVACHTTQMHWRERKLATDWTSLKAQVRRWQANAGLGWSEGDVVEVARYLNALYYRFAPTGELAHAGPGPLTERGAAR
jgi:mono/diheme cytochrome c family protein